MAKIKLIIESHREYDMSAKGVALGIYSYYPPGPWAAKIVEFVSDLNSKLIEQGKAKHCMKCMISEMEGSKAVVVFKGKKEDILSAANIYLAKSEILHKFAVSIK
jgi:hypothetical protein